MRARLSLLVFACACVTTTQVNIGTKTSLERQLIGEFEPLTEEELLAASIRAEGGIGAGSMDAMQRRAVAGRRRQLFNRDDVEEMKGAGCLGEAPRAQLAKRDCTAVAKQEIAERLARLVREENEDREAIIDWAIAVDPVLTPSDRDQVIALYNSLLRQQLRPGDWFQDEGAAWVQRQ
jgi:hypothetical protein